MSAMKSKNDFKKLIRNRPFSRRRQLTTTTRIHFVFAFLFKLENSTED